MFLKNWLVIIVLAVIGLALARYWLSIPRIPDGVTPLGDETGTLAIVASLAGAVTTLGGAIFGVLGKLNDYKKVRLEIEEKELELEKIRSAMKEK